jgi:hypothetical protein
MFSPNDGAGNAAGGIGAGFGDVITDAFEIVGSVGGPTDAHQPR